MKPDSVPEDILKKHFGYSSFRNLQKEIIETATGGKDSIVLMPTGGGKSICYQVPALMAEGLTLVISPLISLMKDQVDALRSLGIGAGYLNSSLTYAEERQIESGCMEKKIRILYLSPEKTLALLDSFIANLPVRLIAIDEAHCVSQWGHDFRPEYKELYRIRDKHPEAVMMALTATADRLTQKDILENLGLKNPQWFVSSFNRANLSLNVRFENRRKNRNREIISFINSRPKQAGIIYCLSRKSTEELALELNAAGIKAGHYHAGMDSSARAAVQDAFLKDNTPVICATIAFGMGIDKSNVRWVIHYNMPKSIESYYQEIGRGGRDGLPADTILYYNISDMILLAGFANKSGQPGINMEKLKRMQEYAESKICRRKILLSYFGESLQDNCGNCDICKNPPERFDGKVIAQMALSALTRISRMNEKAGSTMLINVLRGSKNAELKSKKFDTLKTFSMGKDHSFSDWANYILQLIQLGAIDIAYDEGNTLRVTSFGNLVLQDKVKLDLVKPALWKEEDEEKEEKVSSLPPAEELFEKLRELRMVVARERGFAPYIVFHDTSLRQMVERGPLDKEEMLTVSGVTENKFTDYGYRFLELIRKNSHLLPVKKVNIGEVLSEPSLSRFGEELRSLGIIPSHGTVAKILLGSEKKSLEKVKNISFYGLLKGHSKYKEIAPVLKEYYKPLAEQRTEELRSKAEQFFSQAVYNRVSESSRNELEKLINAIPLEKPTHIATSEFLLGQRKYYPRAGEPWSEKEKQALERVLQLCNDLGYLTRVFGRSPNSIRAMSGHLLDLQPIEYRISNNLS